MKDLYDSLLQESQMVSFPSTISNGKSESRPPVVPTPPAPEIPKVESTSAIIPPINEIPEIVEEVQPVEQVQPPQKEQPIIVDEPVAEIKTPEVHIPEPELPKVEEIIEPAKPIIKKVEEIKSPVMSSAVAAIFDIEESNDLSGKLSSTPVSDLTKAMGLNDKILTLKELFNNQNDVFDKTMSTLNGLNSFDEAKSYLAENVVPKYDWSDSSKIKKAQRFIKLVKRRYN